MAIKFVKELESSSDIRLHPQIRYDADGGISLIVKTIKGEAWNVLRITPQGTLIRTFAIPPDTGIQRDPLTERIRLEEK